MWRHYLKVGFRSLARHKTYAFINLFGLALGVAAALLLLVYIRHETSYDSWLPDSDRIYQVQTIATGEGEAGIPFSQYTHGIIAEALPRDFPQIEEIARVDEVMPVFLRQGEPSFAPMVLADESFFRIIRLPFLRGDPATALAGMDSLVLSRSEAINRFGRVDAVGEAVTAVRRGEEQVLRVTGIFEDLPRDSHMGFRMVGRMSETERAECGWGCVSSFVYLRLRPGAEVAQIERRLPEWERRAVPPIEVGGQRRRVGDLYGWRLVNVRDVHLSGAGGAIDRPGNDRGALFAFRIVALLILGMAAVNFINLTTARSSQRAREVSLRKVMGAKRGQLVAQFLAESVLVTGIAVALALALAELALPHIAAALDLDLEMRWFGGDGILLPALALWAALALAGGIYPAFYLSRYRPAEVLKANKSTAEPVGAGRLRAVLVVAQFAVSIGLIACTLIVFDQTRFARTADLGFEREGLIQVANANRAAIIPQTETLMRQIGRIAGVEGVAGTNIPVASDQRLSTNVQAPGRPEPEQLGFYSVSPEWAGVMGLRLVAGRFLSREFAQDDSSVPLDPEEAFVAGQQALTERGANVVLNAAAARRLGLGAPAEAVGRQLAIAMFGPDQPPVPSTVVGVVADSRFRSLRDSVEPQIFFDRRIYNNFVVRYRSSDPEGVRRQIEEAWRRLAPDVPFQGEFADAQLAALYAADAARGRIFAGFAALAVIIACLGLFGLAAFTAERRTKEIGIRKAFGARGRDIVGLLAWQFSKPVILANLIAWPVAWWAMRDWLNTFDARIELGPGPFLIAGLIALAIALGTVAGHALRVARTSPVQALRYE